MSRSYRRFTSSSTSMPAQAAAAIAATVTTPLSSVSSSMSSNTTPARKGRIRLPTSPTTIPFNQYIRAATSSSSKTKQRLKLLLLGAALCTLVVTLKLSPSESLGLPESMKLPTTWRSGSSGRIEGIYPLDNAPVAGPSNTVASSTQQGSLIILPESIQDEQLYHFVCDISRIHSSQQQQSRRQRKQNIQEEEQEEEDQPIVNSHLTLALSTSSTLALQAKAANARIEHINSLIRNVTQDSSCSSLYKKQPHSQQQQQQQSQKPVFRLPSISTRFLDSSSSNLEKIIQALRPRLLITTKMSDLDDQIRIQQLLGRRKVSWLDESETTWVSMPEADLRHAGWIFTLNEQAIKAWHQPTWKINVITNDRASSLSRLYTSLQTAHYFGDTVDLSIKMEATADDDTLKAIMRWTNSSLLSSPSSSSASASSSQIASGPSSKVWNQGSSHVTFRFRQAGLITNIVEAWYPTSNNEYGFFFEDDIEASPYYFAFAKMAILKYRYGSGTRNTREIERNLYGISLIQQKTSELDRKTGRILWNAESRIDEYNQGLSFLPDTTKEGEEEEELPQEYDVHSPYLSQVPSSWGAVFFPETWREFHDYIQIRDSQEVIPRKQRLVKPSVVSDDWEGSWKRYLIELVFLRGYTMLYPNYKEFKSLSTNHVELGEHINTAKQALLREMQELPLMTSNHILDLPSNILPHARNLPVFDLWGAINTNTTRLVDSGRNAHRELWKCKSRGSGISDYDAYSLFSC